MEDEINLKMRTTVMEYSLQIENSINNLLLGYLEIFEKEKTKNFGNKAGIPFKSKIDLPVSVLQFADSRKNKEIIGILKNRNLSKKDAYFDIAIMVLPEFVIKIIIDIIKWKRD